MSEQFIRIRNARTHNLKDLSIDLPRNQLVIVSGISGSGKSSLVKTISSEGQRRYLESLPTYARQFLSMMEKADVESIEGLSPSIAIEQKSTSHNPRSTVGTVTELYDYLRLLYARVGIARCPDHDYPLLSKSIGNIADEILEQHAMRMIWVLAPMIQNRKGEHTQALLDWQKQGFARIRLNGNVMSLDASVQLDGKKHHTVDLLIDRLMAEPEQRQRLVESLELASRMSDGLIIIHDPEHAKDHLHSERMSCPECGYAIGELEPKMFSFNSPLGACESCSGLGLEEKIDPERMIRHDLSMQGGGLMGWDHQHPYYQQTIRSILTHYGCSMSAKWAELPANVQKVLLYGSGREKIAFEFLADLRGSSEHKAFAGFLQLITKMMERTPSRRDEFSYLFARKACSDCQGSRLRRSVRHVWVEDLTLGALTARSVKQALQWVKQLQLPKQKALIAERILKEIESRLMFLSDVGLDYLTLNRAAETLSGGEAQRIRLATQIGAALVGVTYVLDEPSIGLHQRDNDRLLKTLKHLRDLGNTVIVVEHDEDTMMAADHLVDIGPHAGVHGGQLVAQGRPEDVIKHPSSLTAHYLSGRKQVQSKSDQRQPSNAWLRCHGATLNNLKDIDIDIPLGCFVAVTGVSGSGKSTLMHDTLAPWMNAKLNRQSTHELPTLRQFSGYEHFEQWMNIDQSPIGRTPRSNPATYVGLFQGIRDLFTALPEARARGYSVGRFSFNVRGGRCEHCTGDGFIQVEMHFLADVYVTCEQCQGQRYNRETLEIRYRGKNIAEVLHLTVEEALHFFDKHPPLKRKLQTLHEVGLGYLRLGQSATTLSGGEAQRIKLSRELSKRTTGPTLYLLDEPTTGLHFWDVQLLLDVLMRLRDQGHTIVVIEHHLDLINCADWIIDLGPEGGDEGGKLVVAGPPEAIVNCESSHTGRFLKQHRAHQAMKTPSQA